MIIPWKSKIYLIDSSMADVINNSKLKWKQKCNKQWKQHTYLKIDMQANSDEMNHSNPNLVLKESHSVETSHLGKMS